LRLGRRNSYPRFQYLVVPRVVFQQHAGQVGGTGGGVPELVIVCGPDLVEVVEHVAHHVRIQRGIHRVIRVQLHAAVSEIRVWPMSAWKTSAPVSESRKRW